MSERATEFSTLTPALSPAFISADDAAVYAHELIVAIKNGIVYGGFILSKNHQFFATLPQAGALHSFDPAQVLSLSPEGNFLPMAGYVIEGMYHSNTSLYRVPWAVHEESELQDNFFSIQDLNMAMRYRDNYPRFYLSCPDKCVLSYTASGTDFERALWPLFTRTRPHYPGTFERAYDLGSLMPSHLVGLMAVAGQLCVVLPGGHWARRSRLGVNWTKDQQNPQLPIDRQPVCGPLCSTLLEAVSGAQQQMLKRKDLQQAGYILVQENTGEYVCTRPLQVAFLEFDRSRVFPKNASGVPALPTGYRVVGVYQSGDEHDSELPDALNEVFGDFFSPGNLFVNLLLARATPGCEIYFCTRRGGLLRYNSGQSEAQSTLLAELTSVNGAASELESQLLAAELSARDYVRRVAAAGQLEVVIADGVWTQVGPVDQTWEPFAAVTNAGETLNDQAQALHWA